jgi:hypothetical protein
MSDDPKNDMNDMTNKIDKTLRQVPIPHDLQARLQPEALFDDAAIDRLLAEAAVPSGLEERIRAAVHGPHASHASDASHASHGSPARRNGAIDLSRFATDSLGRSAGGLPLVRPAHRQRRVSLADLGREILSVATALSLVGVLTVAGIEFSRQLEGPPRASLSVTRLDFSEPIDHTADDLPLRVMVPENGWGLPDPAGLSTTAATPEAARDGAPARPAGGGLAWPAAAGRVAENAVVERIDAEPLRPGRPMNDVRGAAMASDAEGQRVGPRALITVETPGVVKRRVPRVRGYDLPFEMTTGEQPFVDPGANTVLAVDRPPLSLSVDGFEALTAAERGPHTRIRSEDVLAAIPPVPGLPVPGAVAGNASPRLTIHEVRSLRTVAGMATVLVEVTASAGSLRHAGNADRAVEPLNVTLVLDQSAAGNAAVWRRVCRAVGDLAAQLGPADRVSVVLAGPRPRVAVQAADRDRLAALASDLEWQGASGVSDLDAGLLLARPADRVVVVAHAVSLQAGGPTVRDALSAWHIALASVGGDSLACEPTGGTRFIVLDPATPSASESAWQEPTFGRTSPDAISIRRALIRQVTRHDTLVASQCELEVRFDPRRVARYRLVGHRQSAVESLADGPPRGTDLHAGETVRVVYEVIPRSAERLGGLVSAVLSWRTAKGDDGQAKAAPIASTADLGDGLPSAHGCDMLLATGVAELAAGSAHGDRPRATVASLQRLVAAWRGRGDMTAFGEAIARSLDQRVGGRTAW